MDPSAGLMDDGMGGLNVAQAPAEPKEELIPLEILEDM